MPSDLSFGAAEIDVTPPLGTPMAGGLDPRPTTWVQDPLFLKAAVLESQGVRLAIAAFDLVALNRETGKRLTAEASRCTGIPPERIFWACTHTHSGPYTIDMGWPGDEKIPVNRDWFDRLPGVFGECVARADAARVPTRLSRIRAYQQGVSHNRRLRYKDGREINTWLLTGEEDHLQCLGAAAPIDPEVTALAFEDDAGRMLGLLWSFALHVNSCWSGGFSAEWPAVFAARMRERFGAQVHALFLPGCCGDLNPTAGYRQVGDALADSLLGKFGRRQPQSGPVRLGAACREVRLPFRDLDIDQEERLQRSQWDARGKDLFRRNLQIMRRRGVREAVSLLSAWRIGDIAFVGLPGEVFCQYGMLLKEKSPFAWTIPVELCGDCLGYFATRQAWEAGGYEGLVSSIAPVSVEGVERMMQEALQMLQDLHSGFCGNRS